jgi:glutathione S-transferase
MLTVHHLNNSRSQRVLWLLEELDLPYEIRRYQRDAETNLAPPELLEVHPLGKSPVLTDDGRVVTESCAIIDYIVRNHADGRLAPPPGTEDHEHYQQWLHYAEGSAMLPLMLKMYTSRLPDGGEALQPRIDSELDNHLGYMDAALGDSGWFVDDAFSAADVAMSFPIEIAPLLHTLDRFPNLADFRTRIQARPAYKRALEKGGDYAFAG